MSKQSFLKKLENLENWTKRATCTDWIVSQSNKHKKRHRAQLRDDNVERKLGI